MNSADRKDFVAAIVATAELYDRELSNGALAIYWHDLSEFSLEEIHQALQEHRRDSRTCQFMPLPGQIRDRILGGSLDDRAEQAWVVFSEAVFKHGPYQSICFSDQALTATVRSLGGWPAACGIVGGQWEHLERKKFVAAYKVFSQAKYSDVPAYLPGIHETNNGREFKQFTEPPRLVGDRELCQKLLAGQTDDKSREVLRELNARIAK